MINLLKVNLYLIISVLILNNIKVVWHFKQLHFKTYRLTGNLLGTCLQTSLGELLQHC